MLRVLWKFSKLTPEQLEVILANHFQFEARTDREIDFYVDHAHWPEQTCERGECAKLT